MNIAALSEPAAAALVPGIFLDPLAIGIVLGGTALGVVLRHRLADAGRALAALTCLWRRPFSADPLIEIDPAWAFAGDFRVVFSNGIGAAPIPEPTAYVVWSTGLLLLLAARAASGARGA